MSSENIGFCLRSPQGVQLYKNIENPKLITQHVAKPPDDVRVVEYSHNGAYIALCDSIKTYLIDAETGNKVIEHDLQKPTFIKFSPKDNYFLTWEQYVIYGLRRNKEGELRTPNPNLNFFSAKDKKYVKTTIARRMQDIPEWTADEKFLIGLSGSEIHQYDGATFEYIKTLSTIKGVSQISVSPHTGLHIYAAYIPPEKNGSQARVELRSANSDKVLGHVFFPQCDKMSLMWNSKGTAVIAMATVEVDTTGMSYYGRSTLQIIDFNGNTFRVNLDKDGPVHDVKWSPVGNFFAVAYGIVPAKVAVFNIRGQVHWDLGEGSRNEVFFNTQGSILAVCGFGSISSGKIQLFDTDKQVEINTVFVSNTTAMGFCPTGKHFYTAITAPRMRVDNCYRLWDYQGKLLFEHNPTTKYELWQVKWQPQLASPIFQVKVPTAEEKKNTGLKVVASNGKTVAVGAVKKTGAYIPPHLRGSSAVGSMKPASAAVVLEKTQNEKDLIKLSKRFKDIKFLKERRDKGEPLEKSQLEKISKEEELLKLIEELKLKVEAEKAA